VEILTAASEFWLPVCELRNRLKCWVRVSTAGDGRADRSDWGMLLIVPVPGYLEGPSGPVPIREVEWVELCSLVVRGGVAGRPLEFVDISESLLAAARAVAPAFELRDAPFSVSNRFSARPARVLHFTNPFRGPGAVG
jgi:hypothetical protein